MAWTFGFHIWYFAIKATATFQAGVIITFLTKGDKKPQIFANKCVDNFVNAVKCIAECLEPLKNVIATFHWSIDGGFRTFGADQDKTAVHLFVCDSMMHIKNVPSTFA